MHYSLEKAFCNTFATRKRTTDMITRNVPDFNET